jgi:hypothetical protein
VAVLRALLLIAGFAAVAALPCALGLLIVGVGEVAERGSRAIRRGFRRVTRAIGAVFGGRWVQRWRLARIARSLRAAPALERAVPTCPPLEQVAADLRRLGRQRLGIATRSPVWFMAVQKAYDDRLRVACTQLGIEEHLSEVSGIDLDVERLRVEAQLEFAGLVLANTGAQPRPRNEQR